MKVLALSIFLVYNCTPMEAIDCQDAGHEISYPDGPYGFRTTIRSIDGELSIDDPDTFPRVCLFNQSGRESCSGDVFDSTHSYWIVILSTEACAPCFELQEDSNELANVVREHFGGDVKVETIYGVSVQQMIRDSWPEIIAGYPRTLVINTDTMENMVDMVGYGDAFWDKLESKLERVEQ
jgi:hypothetical protein